VARRVALHPGQPARQRRDPRPVAAAADEHPGDARARTRS
jgi:hypothetical protein